MTTESGREHDHSLADSAILDFRAFPHIMPRMDGTLVDRFCVGQLYTADEIQNSLGVGNAGGVRLSLLDTGVVRRAVVLTSPVTARQAKENPYHDRIENGILVYTGAGREGDQSLSGVNKRFPQQLAESFPIYAFTLIASRRDRSIGPRRWKFLGLLEYVCHYPDSQVDTRGSIRKVWLFEFRIPYSRGAQRRACRRG